jgi:hypothetical protein
MASSIASASDRLLQVGTIEEAQLLIDEAYTQEILCRRFKELSEIRAKEAIAEACLAYKKLLDAELHTGKVFYVVKASGFHAQNQKKAQPPVVVQITGGVDDPIQINSRSNDHLQQHITPCLSQGMESWKSSWTELPDCTNVFAIT